MKIFEKKFVFEKKDVSLWRGKWSRRPRQDPQNIQSLFMRLCYFNQNVQLDRRLPHI
jgi:hypothetical protein